MFKFQILILSFFLFLGDANAQLEWSRKKQNIVDGYDYSKFKNDWGKAVTNTDFDPILGERLQFALDSTMAVHNIIGTSASLIMPGKGTWQGVYGMSNPAAGNSIRSDMLFGIGSCTKMHVAAVLLKLAEEGLISLDDSLYHWLPAYMNIDSTVTIRQLLSHRSGISDYLGNPEIWDAIYSDFSAYWPPERLLSYVQSPYFKPGTSGRYSNTGYILAGMIIKEATGDTTFTQTLHEKILNPFSLINTMVDVEESLVAELAHGWYDYDGDHIREDVFDHSRTAEWSSFWTAGAMMATAEDLCRFTWHLYRGDILNQTSMNQMFNFNPIYIGNRTEDYGLGVARRELFGEELYGHAGNVDWYTAYTVYSPEYDIGISALVNQDPYDFTPPNFGPSYATGELFRVILDYYNFPHDKVHPFNPQISATYLKTNSDILNVTSNINNPDGHNTEVYVMVKNSANIIVDSTQMYDDSHHGDSLANDNIYGAYLPPFPAEDFFTTTISTKDLDSSYYHLLPEEKTVHFTTSGPVQPAEQAYIDTSYDEIGNEQFLLLLIKNYGSTAKVQELTVTLGTKDTRVAEMVSSTGTISNLDPGATDTSTIYNIFSFKYANGYLPDSTIYNPITFDVTVSSFGYPYWTSSFDFKASKLATSFDKHFTLMPNEFVLSQNHPNPFNPETIITFKIPKAGYTTLEIYNTLGQKVATLLNKFVMPGIHKHVFYAHNLASGIYYYKLVNGEYADVKKMVILR